MLFNSHCIHRGNIVFLLFFFSLARLSLVLALKQFLHMLSSFLLQYVSLYFSSRANECRKSIFCCIVLNPHFAPPPSVIYSFSLSPLPPHGFPNHTTTPLTDAPWQIYCHRLSIGRQCDSWDLMLPSHWPRLDRLIYGCTVIWCLLPLKWVTALSLIGHRNGVRLQS